MAANLILVDDNQYVSPSSGDGYVLVQAGHCYLYEILVNNLTDATRFCQVFDTITGPTVGQVPFAQVQIAANSQMTLRKELPLYRWVLADGLFIVSSTTAATYTAGADTDLFLQIFFAQ